MSKLQQSTQHWSVWYLSYNWNYWTGRCRQHSAQAAVDDDDDDDEDFDVEDVTDEVVEDEEIVRMQPDEYVYESDGKLEDEVTWTEDRMIEGDTADGELFELQQWYGKHFFIVSLESIYVNFFTTFTIYQTG